MHHWSSKLGRVGRSCQNMEATDSLGSITFTRKTQRSVDFEKSLVALLKIIYCTKSRKKHGSGLSLACTLWTVINYVVFRTIFETFRHVTAIDGIHWSISTRISEKFACKRRNLSNHILHTKNRKLKNLLYLYQNTLHLAMTPRHNSSSFFSSFFPGVTDHISFFSCNLWYTAHSPWHESSMAESSSDDLLGIDVGMHPAPVPGV